MFITNIKANFIVTYVKAYYGRQWMTKQKYIILRHDKYIWWIEGGFFFHIIARNQNFYPPYVEQTAS